MKTFALATVLVLLSVAVSYAQDYGQPDTIRVAGDSLKVGLSMPIDIVVANDYGIRYINFGLMSKTLDTGFAKVDSVRFVNRLSSPEVLWYRVTSYWDSAGVPPDTTVVAALSGQPLPPGNDAVVRLWMTGLTPGSMIVDSGWFPPAGQFGLMSLQEHGYGMYTPTVIIDTLTVVSGTLPPILALPADDPRTAAGSEVTFDCSADSPEDYPVEIELFDFSLLETGGGTPTNEPELVDGDPAEFTWSPTASDVGLWSARIRACDTAGMCVMRSVTIQVVSDADYLLSFDQTETPSAPEAIHMVQGNSDSDIEPELFICSVGRNYPKTACLLDLNQDMTFDTVWTYPNGYAFRGPVRGYLNGDKNLDFVMLGSTTETAYIMLGDGDNGFSTIESESFYNTFARGAVLGEFTGDQYLDYVVVNNWGIGMFQGDADSVLSGQGFPIPLGGGEVAKSVTSADFDDDGLDDLAIGTESGLKIYLSTGSGGFNLNASYSQTYGSFDIEVTNMGSDFNNDDLFDLCLATPSVGGTHSQLVVYLGNGDGTFSQTIIRTPLGHVMADCTGDFNNDGNLDIAYVNGSEQYCAILFGDGDGSFTNELRYDIDKYLPIQVICFDADSDADLDLVVASYESQSGASLFVLENQLDPDGFTAMPVVITAEDNAQLALLSPSGQVVNNVRSSIASGEYQRRNSNQNGSLDDAITFNTAESGVYTLSASPKPGVAKSVETFSLEMTFGSVPYRFAEQSTMASSGYNFDIYPFGGSPVYPAPGSWVYNDNPVLRWPGSGSFDLQVATDIDFASLVATATVDGSSYQVSPLDTAVADLYFWRVKPEGQSEYEVVYPFNLALVDCIRRGNVDHDPAGQIDISDLIHLVDFMFNSGPEPPNLDEANVDGLAGIEISDLVYLVDYMFTNGPEPPACP
ncbi:MAG: VCBS repeat-containing protein [candidate division Zixibacteria bacterium]|nr:VCBS repeat-containing protein [candidate division Zixibacteria bacterium]MDH3935873.1 VCBS repeat-containing protein [candidate division Zixibacteria bacterium]MDH4032904.1 VCBS repeat-containing protein [candidate division Zixibacteria bacterium]